MIFKRFLDIVGAVAGLILLAPAILLFALAIKLDSTGPVLFRQTRVGYQGKLFLINKFRTMVWSPGSGGIQITQSTDPRITRIGRFLRKTKLDEVPQLWNVLVGDMSLVGPRPEVPRYVEYYPEDLRSIILSVRPGITDLASIEFVDENRLLSGESDLEAAYARKVLPRKLELCALYVTNRSARMDVAILVRTVYAVLRSFLS